jgi:AcrB/AcrD/AcrF family
MMMSPENGQALRSGISGPFIKYPVATTLLMIGVLFIGIIGYISLPVAPLPQVDFPTIQVCASYPGASPETMASSVAQPLERQFAQIPDLSEMTSSSALGRRKSHCNSAFTAISTPPPMTCRRRSTLLPDNCRPTCQARRLTERPIRPIRRS